MGRGLLLCRFCWKLRWMKEGSDEWVSRREEREREMEGEERGRGKEGRSRRSRERRKEGRRKDVPFRGLLISEGSWDQQ